MHFGQIIIQEYFLSPESVLFGYPEIFGCLVGESDNNWSDFALTRFQPVRCFEGMPFWRWNAKFIAKVHQDLE